jgi:hypothetical protein
MIKRISLKCSAFLERHDSIDAAKNVSSDTEAWIVGRLSTSNGKQKL